MYQIFFTIIICILTITTLCIGIFKPQMHKVVMVYNSDYKIEETVPETKTVKNIPTQTNTYPTEQKTTKLEQETQLSTSVNQISQANKQTPKTTKTSAVANKQTNSTTVNQVQNSAPVTLPKSIQKITQTTQTEPVKQTITEEQRQQQELILWNKWRSNLQNQIMRDVKLPIVPDGTIFKFSFEVDKYGKVSNVKTWSVSPNYTPYAIQYIAPVIRSYQGRSILEFPTGSNRFSTVVEGAWKIAKTAKYSTPDDYKDTEKVNK